MKKLKDKTSKIFRVLCIGILGLSLAACEDFLDRPPFDKFDNAEFWQNEAQARAFMYAVYPVIFPGYGMGTTEPSTFYGETSNDDYMSAVAQTELGPLMIPTSDNGWNFANVRKANYIIENVGRLNLDEAGINHWRGIGRFFRAVFYSNMVFTYGDVPYMDHVPVSGGGKEDEDYLYKDRDPRTFVVGKIMEDFQYAMDYVRPNDGSLQINKYVVAAMASRLMLREGAFLKYHGIDAETADKCLKMSKKASELVMSGPYRISDNYNALFSSDDLAGNTEVIIYRKYLEGIVTHSMWAITSTSPVQGASKSLAESFLRKDGFPIYYDNAYWIAPTSNDFFTDRDPRLNMSFRPKYYVRGENPSNFAYAISGYSCQKYTDDSKIASTTSTTFTRGMNVTDAPCLRLGEVLLNYAEACYELDTLDQTILDKTVNVLRDRKGVEMPHLQIVGEEPAVNGVVYDDPKRLQIDPSVPSLLWEIRRERRVELNMEGFRRNDLKRWKKLDYMMNAVNPDIRYGAYIRLSDYPNKDASIVLEDPVATEGYILGNTSTQRVNMPTEKNYVNPIPTNQITLYKNHGYTLTQTEAWREE